MKRNWVAMAACVAWILCTSVRLADAAWPHDPNNGNVPLCTAGNGQNYPSIVSDGAGGAIVVWQDMRGGVGSPGDILAQRVNAAGATQWVAQGASICTAINSQLSPTIVSDRAGGAVIAWYDIRSGTNYDIYAQRVNASGVSQWTGNGVALCTAAGHQQNPVIDTDGAGGAIVAWYDSRGGNSDIYVQWINAAGVPQWNPNGVPLCTLMSEQINPRIVSDGAGGAIVVWQDQRNGNQDLYAQRVNALGVPQWTSNGIAVCTALGMQASHRLVPDGSGGAIVTWQDTRSGGLSDIYVQRLSASGAALWTGQGLALCTASSDQGYPTLASDGVGGAIVTWNDTRSGGNYDVYAQRVNAAGSAMWTVDGIPICTASGIQGLPNIAADGAGGAFLTWLDVRSGNSDVYAQRVTSGGATLWTANGVALCSAVGDQYSMNFPEQTNNVIVADGLGGAIVTWEDNRNAGDTDVYAQRVERFGYLGNPEPLIASARDVPNDQGGKVKVSWFASYLDQSSDPNLTAYDIYRSAPSDLAAKAVGDGARKLASFADVPTAGERAFVIDPTVNALQAWEYLATVNPVHFLNAYAYLASTTGDSIAGSNPYTQFMVVGRNSNGSMYWLSPVDSAYSVDDLAPLTPGAFTAGYAPGTTYLHWAANGESDLAGYRLYRGGSADFVPGPWNQIAAQPDTGFVDPVPAGSWYKLSAVDAHGNESPFATLAPGATTGVVIGATTSLYLATPWPTPSVGGTTFRFGLPRTGPVTLTLFDQQGRRVRELIRGVQTAGEHRVSWDGCDALGVRVASGLYFARLEHDGQRLVTRVIETR
jgi:hypothetical protein